MQLLRQHRPAPALPAAQAGEPCRCGHISVAHQHYRRGTDCALCGCAKYHAAQAGHGRFGGLVRALLGVLRERRSGTA